MHTSEKTLSLDVESIHYNISGSGETILLIHGFMENLSIWNDFSEELSKSHQVISIDLPGHGKSSQFRMEEHSMEWYAQLCYEVLAENDINEIHIIGHSLGGYVALAFLELFEIITRSICLFHSTTLDDSIEKKKTRDLTIKAVQSSHQFFLSQFVPKLFDPENVKKYSIEINQLIKEAKTISQESIIKTTLAMRNRIDRTSILEKAEIPKNIIIGQNDPVIPYYDIEEIAKQTGSSYTIVNNCGHMGFIEQKKCCLNSIKQHLNISN